MDFCTHNSMDPHRPTWTDGFTSLGLYMELIEFHLDWISETMFFKTLKNSTLQNGKNSSN